jgi:hypothetical protein
LSHLVRNASDEFEHPWLPKPKGELSYEWQNLNKTDRADRDIPAYELSKRIWTRQTGLAKTHRLEHREPYDRPR